ncbi:hypothetical protein [Streptomyces sp. KLOTTS4A1]|uniref:hypothetical protein n=1 Tax=Streptomyces sp. KLOTTS4A1 TaxID=3390996 RepID=UPI0039F5FBD5
MARLGRLLPHLSGAHPLEPQLAAAVRAQREDPELAKVAQTVTSQPGRAAELLQHLFYTWLRLAEPEHPATVPAVPVPERPVGHRPRSAPHEEAMFVTASLAPADDSTGWRAAGEVTLRRYPAADRDDPDRRRPRTADVLLVPVDRASATDDDPWCAYAAAFSGCGLIAEETAEDGCRALLRGGRGIRAR